MTADVHSALETAAADIETNGWVQHTYTDDENGAHCLVGAVVRAVGGDFGESSVPLAAEDLFTRTLRAVADHVPTAGRHDLVLSLSRWNDADNRRPGEVLEVLRAAARAQAVHP